VNDAPKSKLLRTTTVQAFARTMVDVTRRSRAGARREDASEGSSDDGLDDPDEVVVTFDLPDIGDVVGGHYKLVRLLGQGMFGKVYVAERLDVPEHRVALKLLPRSLYAGRNVERELVMLATVGHPNVVQLKDHGTTPDYVWLTMPVYQGETLHERLQKRGPLSPKQAYEIFLPMARGLDALHAAGLRHQDVKPENIFLATFGGRLHPVLLDLGVAAEKDAVFIAGTALYGAPEQVAALSGLPVVMPLSEKMDTYGLAATLLMALVGPKHFPGEKATNRAELAEAQELRTTEPISMGALAEVTGAPRAELEACFKRWLAFSPDDRPSMSELADQLDVLLEPQAEEERREQSRRDRQKRTILWFQIAVAGMLVIGVAGGALVFNQRETLRIAADLDRAKSAGDKNFSELSTCNAAHAEDSKAIAECKAGRDKSLADYKQQLDEVMRSGSTTQAEHARDAQRYLNKLKACDEAATAQRRTCEDEAATLAGQNAREKATLAAQRDEAQRQAEVEKAAAAAREAERDVCRAEKSVCVEERDALKAQVVQVTQVAQVAQVAQRPSLRPGVVPASSGAPAPSTDPSVGPAPKAAPSSGVPSSDVPSPPPQQTIEPKHL
jgi:serine/threonine protein kinase